MPMEPIDYAAFLADLDAKIAALEATRNSVRAAMALGTLGQSTELPEGMQGTISSMPSMTSYSGDVPAGAFHGKSLPEAAVIYLSMVKKKQTSAEIAEALKKGGLESTSKNFVQMVHSGLDRARLLRKNSPIVKFDRSHWGLKSWLA